MKTISIPARLDYETTAKLLGFPEHDIPVLVKKGLLKPLGKPVPNCSKYFAACEIEALSLQAEWLHKATQAIYDRWHKKNAKKKRALPQPQETVLTE
jgi:hypothetical protein